MFGKILYYDKGAIAEYKAIIRGKKGREINEYSYTRDRTMTVGGKGLRAGQQSSSSFKATVQDNYLYDCDEFEKMLTQRDDYYDFTTCDDYDIETVPRSSIVRMEVFLEVPETFDNMRATDSFKPMLIDMVTVDLTRDSEKDAVKELISKANATKIPTIINFNSNILCAKLEEKNLMIDYEAFEEIEDEVTIIARISSNLIKKEKPFYDPLKDYYSLNRVLRKGIGEKERGKELSTIRVENDYRMVDILAIYE